MDVNPLNVTMERQLNWLPPHFTCVTVSLVIQYSDIASDIYNTTSGRFAMVQGTKYSDLVIGFEDPVEASYFKLMSLQYKK